MRRSIHCGAVRLLVTDMLLISAQILWHHREQENATRKFRERACRTYSLGKYERYLPAARLIRGRDALEGACSELMLSSFNRRRLSSLLAHFTRKIFGSRSQILPEASVRIPAVFFCGRILLNIPICKTCV